MVYTGTYVGFRKFEKEMFVKLDINVGDFLTAFAAIAAGLVALAQYLKSERWKRAEFAIAQMRSVAALSIGALAPYLSPKNTDFCFRMGR